MSHSVLLIFIHIPTTVGIVFTSKIYFLLSMLL